MSFIDITTGIDCTDMRSTGPDTALETLAQAL